MILKNKNKYEEEEQNKTDRYLITYSDLITLLLGLFVILYAISQVDESKFKEISKAFSVYFNPNQKTPLEGPGVLPGNKGNIPDPVGINSNKKTLDEIKADAETALKKYIDSGSIKVKKTDNGVVLMLPEMLLFNSGKADINASAAPLLDSLAKILSVAEMQITVAGHTDAAPIKTLKYESNWHLSAARAANVGYSLIERGMPPQSLVVCGYGDQRPISPNTTEEGKMRNRRVEITISNLPSNAPSVKGYQNKDIFKK